jgi:hypothetical protein
MKKAIIVALLATLFSFSASAQTETRLSQCPAKFRTFYAKFKAAVLRNDKNSVVSMTKFPFQWGFDAGDEGKYTQKQFIRNFGRFFDGDPRNIIRERNPLCSRLEKGSIDVTSEDATHLNFIPSGSGYKFAAYLVEP